MQKNTHTHKHHINLKVFKGTKVSKLRSNMLAGDWGEGEEEEGGGGINQQEQQTLRQFTFKCKIQHLVLDISQIHTTHT